MSRFDFRGMLWPKWIKKRWLNAGGFPQGTSEPAVGQLLYALAIARRARVIVETGLMKAGGSTPWLAWAAQEVGALHVAVDVDKHACEDAIQMVKSRGWLIQRGQIVGTTVLHADAIVAAGMFADEAIDFLFIDDNHETDHVRREIEAFLPKMHPGGAMFFHDVIGTGNDFQIWDLIQPYGGIRLANHTYNYPENQPAGGLGMISVHDVDRNGLYNVPPVPIAWGATEWQYSS